MGCVFSQKSGSTSLDGDSNNNFTEQLIDGDDSSDADYKKSGPSGAMFPIWMRDEESDSCLSCSSKFNSFVDRKHHCRRW